MSSAAARSFGVSAFVMRPAAPYLKAPPFYHIAHGLLLGRGNSTRRPPLEILTSSISASDARRELFFMTASPCSS
jgi:hypothetical protein